MHADDWLADNPLARAQAANNRSTRDHWDHFADHRDRVADLILPNRRDETIVVPDRSRQSLAVLGAGNCNDLDLPQLLDSIGRVTLVDIDADAVRQAVTRQGVENHPRLTVRTGIDLTAAASRMARWKGTRVDRTQVQRCIAELDSTAAPEIGGPFDIVLSPCLLSQLCLLAHDTIGPSHPEGRALRLAIRRRHLRQVVDWLVPGGRGIFVIDLVQTARLGSLAVSHRNKLSEAAARAVGKMDHFPDLDPRSLVATLTQDAAFAGLTESVQSTPPWLWTLGPKKSFLAYALTFRRTAMPLLNSAG